MRCYPQRITTKRIIRENRLDIMAKIMKEALSRFEENENKMQCEAENKIQCEAEKNQKICAQNAM